MIQSPSAIVVSPTREPPVLDVDVNVLAADDGALAHAARDDRGVARHAAARREHRARGDDAVKILRRRLVAHEDHVLARGRALLGDVGIEHGDAARGARARGKSRAERRRAHAGVDHRMQQLIELLGRHAQHGGRVSIEPFVHHVGRDAHRGGRRALAGARLQQIEPPALDGELDVLHVAEVPLEPLLRLRAAPSYASGSRLRHLVDARAACECPRRRPRPAR